LNYFHLIILGLVQGLTEFLPVSSSAHLILLPQLAGWEDQGLVYDIAAHLGSLIAVILFFRDELQLMISAWWQSLVNNSPSDDARLLWCILVATIPVSISGFLLYDTVATLFRNPVIIASATILFGLILLWSDITGTRIRQQDELQIKDALIVGIVQVMALIPGTSRSGITMTAGLMLGFNRHTAARFSFYLAIPVILLAGGFEVFHYFQAGDETDPVAFLIVVMVSGTSAWFAIKFFLALVERTGMLPYVVYRILLGGFLFYLYL
jgi:undecaprenyl-diphosphatase